MVDSLCFGNGLRASEGDRSSAEKMTGAQSKTRNFVNLAELVQ